jgi:hypothetical protein
MTEMIRLRRKAHFGHKAITGCIQITPARVINSFELKNAAFKVVFRERFQIQNITYLQYAGSYNSRLRRGFSESRKRCTRTRSGGRD